MSTSGWVFEYGLVAFLFLLCVGVAFFAWGQDRVWRWQDRRDAKRGARQVGGEPK
ncbi:hypothetical protein [Pedococcus sp. 5OH_020]|uniref:hypothetical protein n=1 Tax=Pedococcus sp. 5OH_020 TaxID=2989814 RepID=UPI0022E9BD6C|nr:hypothetical protein [Pedococcus sp. 5OH_020]